MLRKALLLSICFLMSNHAAYAANAKESTTEFLQDSEKNLKILENRFFFHDYNHDLIEKRLERLELLVLGGVQSGSNRARLDRLKAMVQQKDSQAAKDLQVRNKEIQDKKAEPGVSVSEAQYPVLTTLEWRALKKTYKADSLDKRLDRLETSIFGTPSNSMSYADRVDRLKKVVGIEQIEVNNKLPQQKIGPPPRAEKQFQYDERGILMDQTPMMPPGPEFKDLAESSMRFRKFFDEMQKMMMLLPGMDGSGSGLGPGFGPNSGMGQGFIQQFTIPFPNMNPNLPNRMLTLPQKSDQAEEGNSTIPPYIDPNSI